MPWFESLDWTSRVLSTIRSIASSHEARSSFPLRRINGYRRRSGWSIETHLGPVRTQLAGKALDSVWYPLSPFGPRRPLFTRSETRPRTPTTRPSFTPMSRPQPLLNHSVRCAMPSVHGKSSDLHSTHALCTHFSGSSVTLLSHLTGHSCLYGVRGPQISAIESRVSRNSRGMFAHQRFISWTWKASRRALLCHCKRDNWSHTLLYLMNQGQAVKERSCCVRSSSFTPYYE